MLGSLIFFSVILYLSYAILILFYRRAWLQLPDFFLDKNYHPQTSISVIIPARNEAKNIAAVLKDILSQYYPTHLMEIIVVDDHSEDATAEIVKTFHGVKLISLCNFTEGKKLNAYKKKAIEIAIAQSKGELILTTDADCKMNAYWLLSIVQYYEMTHPQLIASPVTFSPVHSWFDRFQSLDFMTMQGITGAVAQSQSGTMCNGANLAYAKSAFEAVNGFKDIDDIASGDDMLLMYKIEKKFPSQTTFLKCKEALVSTETMPTFRAFLQQRIRWASKATKFKDKRIQVILLLVYLFNFILLLLFCCAVLKLASLGLFVGFLIAKTILELYFLRPVAIFFGKQNELKHFPLMQFVHIPYILFSGFFSQFGKYNWKERSVK
jgi:cellulose synthase/poly-beta-1,6-N-acetylglucosamine synthase-like glycosyltransferase